MEIIIYLAMIILVLIIMLVFIRKNILEDMGILVKNLPKFVKNILYIVCIGLLIYIIIFEIMHFLK